MALPFISANESCMTVSSKFNIFSKGSKGDASSRICYTVDDVAPVSSPFIQNHDSLTSACVEMLAALCNKKYF
jgi:hypothetical protein